MKVKLQYLFYSAFLIITGATMFTSCSDEVSSSETENDAKTAISFNVSVDNDWQGNTTAKAPMLSFSISPEGNGQDLRLTGTVEHGINAQQTVKATDSRITVINRAMMVSSANFYDNFYLYGFGDNDRLSVTKGENGKYSANGHPSEVASAVTAIAPQYEQTFNHIGRFKEDYQVLDICRNLEYFDLMELLLPGILEINPYYNMGWTLLGVSQEMNGHYAEATSSLEYALAINPDDIPANVTYAQCMQVMGNFDRAIQYLLRYRELTNDFSQDIAIAKCYLNLKDYPNVRKYLIHPFEHVKNHPDTRQITDELMELAELLYACDEIDKTEDILNLLLANKPKHRTGLLLKGCVKLHKGNVEDAISLFVEIIEKFNFSPDILTDVASRFLAFEYEDISLRLLTAATESLTAEKKKSGRQHALMAVALLKKGIIDEALNHLKIACDTDTSYVKMYFADFLPDSIQENDYYEHLSSFFNSK